MWNSPENIMMNNYLDWIFPMDNHNQILVISVSKH